MQDQNELSQEIKQKYQEQDEFLMFKEQMKNYTYEIGLKNIKPEKVTKIQNKIKEADGKSQKKKAQEGIIKEIKELNLEKFTQELAYQIADCYIYPQGLRFFIEICVILNNYPQFTQQLVKCIHKQIEKMDQKVGPLDTEQKRAEKRINLMRFVAELHNIILSNDQFLEIFKMLLPQNPNIEFLLLNIKVLQNFMSQLGYEYFYTVNYQTRQEQKAYQSQFKTQFRIKTSNQLEIIINQYITFIQNTLKNLYKEIEKKCSENQLTINDYCDDQQIKLMKENYSNMKESYRQIMDNYGKYDPDIDVEGKQEEESINLYVKNFEQSVQNSEDCFNAYEKSLYLQLIKIDQQALQAQIQAQQLAQQQAQLAQQAQQAQQVQQQTQVNSNVASSQQSNGQNILQQDQIIQKKECSSIEIADQMAQEFQNNQKNRRKLIEDILNYKQNYMVLMPFQCRLLANICKNYRESEEDITKMFVEAYKQTKTSEGPSDRKGRYLRYLCELTKFSVLKQDIILEIFQSLIEDITSQNIELIVIILENVGKFLKYSMESNKKFSFQLKQLEKQRNSKPIAQQQENLLNNALLALDTVQKIKKEKSLLQQYIKYLFINKLEQQDKIMEHILQLPIHQCQNYLIKYILKAIIKGKFQSWPIIAGIIAYLNKNKYSLLVGQIVDGIMDEIQNGLEDNQINLRQRRITMIRMVGQLYDYQIIEQDLIFQILYLLIENGHEYGTSKQQQDLIDPPDDPFRINQAVNLIESLPSFQKKYKLKLIIYLINFQRYVLSKRYLPQSVEFALLDLYEVIDVRLSKIRDIKQAEKLALAVQQYNVNLDDLLNQLPEPTSQIKQVEKIVQNEEDSQLLIQKKLDEEYLAIMTQYDQQNQKQQSNKKVKATIKGNTAVKIIQREIPDKKKKLIIAQSQQSLLNFQQ
ncbi:hypothetical protein pb186bvf_008905 [Paramecium bursaria]